MFIEKLMIIIICRDFRFSYICSAAVKKTYILWESQVENEHYSTVSGLIQLVIFLECFIEITPDFLCPFMND